MSFTWGTNMPSVKLTGVAELLHNADARIVELGIRGEKSETFKEVQLVDYNYSGVTVRVKNRQVIIASSEIIFITVLETNQEYWKSDSDAGFGSSIMDSLI